MKGWLWLIVVPVLVFLKDLLLNDLTSWGLSSLADRVLRLHAAKLPTASATRYLEEWRAELCEINEPTRKIGFAIGLFWGMRQLREEAVSAEREAAQAEHNFDDDVVVQVPTGTLEISGAFIPSSARLFPPAVSVPSDGWMTTNRIASVNRTYRTYQANRGAVYALGAVVHPPPLPLTGSVEETFQASDLSMKSELNGG